MLEMCKRISGKLRAKFPATTLGCSMVKIGRLDDTFLEVCLTASRPRRKSITAAKRKENEKKEREKSSKDVGHLLVQNLKIMTSAHP